MIPAKISLAAIEPSLARLNLLPNEHLHLSPAVYKFKQSKANRLPPSRYLFLLFSNTESSSRLFHTLTITPLTKLYPLDG